MKYSTLHLTEAAFNLIKANHAKPGFALTQDDGVVHLMPADSEMVDLGLPSRTLWAKCNLGANSPEEVGYYYAWGETETKENYNNNTYEFGTHPPFSRYDEDGITTLLPEDDAATVLYGEGWHTPTLTEFKLFIQNTTWSWSQLNNVYGALLTSNINGHTLFIPVSGYRYNTDYEESSTVVHLWSSSLTTNAVSYAKRFVSSEEAGEAIMNNEFRYPGLNIRPVYRA